MFEIPEDPMGIIDSEAHKIARMHIADLCKTQGIPHPQRLKGDEKKFYNKLGAQHVNVWYSFETEDLEIALQGLLRLESRARHNVRRVLTAIALGPFAPVVPPVAKIQLCLVEDDVTRIFQHLDLDDHFVLTKAAFSLRQEELWRYIRRDHEKGLMLEALSDLQNEYDERMRVLLSHKRTNESL